MDDQRFRRKHHRIVPGAHSIGSWLKLTGLFLLAALAATGVQAEQATADSCTATHASGRDLQLGAARAFAEMVAVGVKRLALSSVMTAEEADAMEPLLAAVADAQGVALFREPDLLVTLLFPADVASEKTVFLIYTDDVLDRYLALKQQQRELQRAGRYDRAAQIQIATTFGELLSYPDATIERFIAARLAAEGS